MQVRSRLAPTPSGFLHLGNAVNFLLTWLLVRKLGGVLSLRIDDADCARTRPEYIADIFRQLDWLGLDWDEGPQGPDQFHREYSQLQRIEEYRGFLAQLEGSDQLYACACSRSRIRRFAPNGIYPGLCRGMGLAPVSGGAVRVRVPEDRRILLEGRALPLFALMGDFVLWRKDCLPAYQLASLADDIAHQVNLVVRGEDLLASTAAQLFLAGLHGKNRFAETIFFHHPLLPAENGGKLSKSDGALSLQALRQAGAGPELACRAAAKLLGLDPDPADSPTALLAAFHLQDGQGLCSQAFCKVIA